MVRVLSSLHHHVHRIKNGGNSSVRYIEYCRSWAWQQVLLTQRLSSRKQQSTSDKPTHHHLEDKDSILLLEHAPVYTLGRGASEEHLLFLNDRHNSSNCDDHNSIRQRLSRKYRGPDSARLVMNDRRALEDMLQHNPPQHVVNKLCRSTATPVLAPNGVPIYRVDRGGEVTFHGPSQLVVYPLLDLKQQPFKADLHWFLRQVEEVVIQTLKHYGIDGVRDAINSGVWVRENKIAAIGVSATSWISSHGFSLNVSPDLEYFDTEVILPCGIEGRGVTSIKQELAGSEAPSIDEVAGVVLQQMEAVFGLAINRDPQRFNMIQ